MKNQYNFFRGLTTVGIVLNAVNEGGYISGRAMLG